MGLRDRFFTPATAKAILSWRIALGAAVTAAIGLAAGAWAIAVLAGLAVYATSVAIAMPKARRAPQIDAFALGEPWRQIVQGSQSATRKLRATIDGASDGPLKQRLLDIARQVEHGVVEVWEVAQRGNDIDRTVRHLDPTALRSKLATLEQRQADAPTPDGAAAVESVQRQIESAERLGAKSADAATRLRLNQTRLDELVAGAAAEVRIGAAEPESYARDVDDLIVQLEALHRAVAETHGSESPSP